MSYPYYYFRRCKDTTYFTNKQVSVNIKEQKNRKTILIFKYLYNFTPIKM